MTADRLSLTKCKFSGVISANLACNYRLVMLYEL